MKVYIDLMDEKGLKDFREPFLKELKKMKKQKVTFELDKKLDNASVDELMYLLKDAGATNIEIDWDEGYVKEVKALNALTQSSKEEIEDGGYAVG